METGEMARERDEMFSLLSNQRRRFALHACKRFGTPMELSDLAERVAAWEYDKQVSELETDERRRVYTSMQQSHLPAMEDAGVIEFDGREVTLTGEAEDLEIYMEIVPEDSIPWGKYYLGLSLISALVLGGVALDVYPESIPDLVWAAMMLAAFGVSSAAHVLWSRGMKIGNADEPPELR